MEIKAKSIFFRYLLILLISFGNLYLFYFIFTPLTIYPVYYFLSLFYDITLNTNVLEFAQNKFIEIIPACVAGSAYYLLFILNLSIPNKSIKKYIKMLGLGFGILLILNVFRIIFLSLLYLNSSALFNQLHFLFWYILSTIFVIGIWFIEVKTFKIKEIPMYSDIKFLISKIK